MPSPPGPPGRGGAEERKHVTVLFADVVGFTATSERFEPETVREMMDGCFAVLEREVERYGGTVNSFTGDGLMALFGVPVAYEDHAVRAVHAAWSIQDAMAGYAATVAQCWQAPFQLRLGLHTGLVVVGAVGGFKMDFTAMGDTVNLAARVQAAAAPGGILVTEATYRAAGGGFVWRPAGPLTLKGKSKPVEAYEVTGLGSTQDRFEVLAQRGLTRFVGRDAELAQLVDAWERAAAGEGQVVSVVGEAGLGKSRLLHEFKAHLAAADVPFIEGSCFAYGEITPYLPFLEIVRAAGAAQAAALDPDDRVFLDALLGVEVTDEHLARLPAAVVRQRTVAAICTLLLAKAATEPLALIVEDVHWIDAASQEILAALVEAMTAAHLVVVLTYRPEYLHAWAGKAHHAEITVGRLGGASTAAMVRAILAKPYAGRVALEPFSAAQRGAMLTSLLGTVAVPADLEALVADRTDGNPLFTEELIRSLLESGDLSGGDDGYVLARPEGALVIPTTVQGVLMERVDRLTADLKSILQVASVLGRVFAYPLLQAVTGRGPHLDPALLELEDLDFVYPTSLAPERTYSFKHILTQEAVYDTLVRKQKEAWHERAGEAMEALYPDRLEELSERIADHYRRSPNRDKALEFLTLANGKAIRTHALAEAKAHLEGALSLLAELPDEPAYWRKRISLLTEQFDVFHMLLEVSECQELLRRFLPMAEDLGDSGLLGMYRHHLAHCQLWLGDTRGALAAFQEALEPAREGGHHAAVAIIETMLALTSTWLGSYVAAAAWFDEAFKVFQDHFEPRRYIWARSVSGVAHAKQGRWDRAVEDGEDAVRVGRQYRDDSLVTFASAFLAQSHAWRGDHAQALEYARLAQDKAPTPADGLWAGTFTGLALCRAGEHDRAIELLEEITPVYDMASFPLGQCWCGLFLGEAYWRGGRPEDARRTLATVVERAEQACLPFYLGSAERLLGEVTGERAHFERAITGLTEIGAENELALALAGRGHLLARNGDPSAAREDFTRSLQIFERLGTLLEPERIRDGLDRLPLTTQP